MIRAYLIALTEAVALVGIVWAAFIVFLAFGA